MNYSNCTAVTNRVPSPTPQPGRWAGLGRAGRLYSRALPPRRHPHGLHAGLAPGRACFTHADTFPQNQLPPVWLFLKSGLAHLWRFPPSLSRLRPHRLCDHLSFLCSSVPPAPCELLEAGLGLARLHVLLHVAQVQGQTHELGCWGSPEGLRLLFTFARLRYLLALVKRLPSKAKR